MGKKILKVLMVMALIISLPVFSYAVEPPAGTAILEYIQSSGAQYINTAYVATSDNYSISSDFEIPELQPNTVLFGGGSSTDIISCLLGADTHLKFYVGSGSVSGALVPVSADVPYDLSCTSFNGNFAVSCNGSSYGGVVSGSLNKSFPLFIFANNNSGSPTQFSSYILSSFSIIDNSLLVRDYIPVRMNGDVGLWDRVEGEFYGNSGTGLFIGGPVSEIVVPSNPEYNITVSSDGNGSVSSSVSTATAGTTVTLTATPAANYVFSEWQVLEGDIDIVNNQFIMPGSNVSVKAIFVPDGTHSVTVENDGNGVGSANPVRAEQGTRITLSAVPVLGYEFDSWEVVSGAVNISNNQFIMPDSDVVVKAKFKPIVYTITLNQVSNGSATVSQTTGIIGDVITLTATPDDLYSFSHWDVTLGGITVENNQFVMPASDVVLTPVFIKQTAVSSGYKFNSGVHDDSDITARMGLADISFGELPAGEYLINIYSYGQNYGVSYDIGVGSDTTKGRKLPYIQSGGVTTALYTHSGGEMVLDLNFTYYKSVLNSPRSGSDVITGNWYEGTGALTGVITSWVVSSSNWIFNIIDVTATPVGLANSEDYGIYAGIISFLRDKFDDLISVFGSDESEEDVNEAADELNKEVEDLNNLGGQLSEEQSNLETQFDSDFKVSDDISSQTSTFQGIYSGLFSSLGVFSIFIWLPVVFSVIKKLLRL